MKKEQLVTTKYLNKKLEEHARVIVAAVDGVLDKRLREIKIDTGLIKQGLKQTKDELKKDINNVQRLIDGYVKAQEEFKQEFVIMKEEMKQIKKVLKEKLGVEIHAI